MEHVLAPALLLREGDREKLGDLARLPSAPSGLAKRARMIRPAANGVPNAEIADGRDDRPVGGRGPSGDHRGGL